MSYQAFYDPGNNPDYPYFIRVYDDVLASLLAVDDTEQHHPDYIGPSFSRREAGMITLGVNLLEQLVKIGPQRDLPYGALPDANNRDNLDRSAAQQELCEHALQQYRDLMRASEHRAC